MMSLPDRKQQPDDAISLPVTTVRWPASKRELLARSGEAITGWPVGDGVNELLRRCQQGEETALDGLVRLDQQRIFHLACRVLGDAALAEEATAQTLVKIWSRCGQWRGQSAAGTWVYRIAVRTVLDVQRSQNRWWRHWSRPGPAEVHDPGQRPDEGGLAYFLKTAIARLNQDPRAELSPVEQDYSSQHTNVGRHAAIGLDRRCAAGAHRADSG